MALLCIAKRLNRPSCTSSGALMMTLSLFLFYGLELTRSVTPVDGLTLHINSGQPAAAAAPMSASLYMAPQTYDRGKERFQRRRNPYILVPKVRLACDWTLQGLGRGSHPHRHKVEAVDVDINTPPPPSSSSSSSPLPWSDVGSGVHHALQSNDFPGSWQINKPDSMNQDRPINELVTYNEDGTRVVIPETLFNNDTNMMRGGPASSSTTRKPAEYIFHNITSDISAAETTSPKPEVTSSEQSVQTIAATTTDGDQTRTDDSTMTIGTVAPRPLKRGQEFYSVTVATTATAATYTDRYNADDDDEDDDDDVTTNQAPTIMDKLGGGAKKILAHILGGILHGRQTQKNLGVKDAAASSTVDRNSDRLTVVDSVAFSPISYSNLLPNFSSSSTADHHFENVGASAAKDTGATSTGDHPMKEAPITTTTTTAASNSNDGRADGGWRPVIQWPSAWLNGRPARRPAPPPANLMHYWTSTRWNDTIAHLNVNTGSREVETEQSIVSGERPSFAEATSTTSLPPPCQNNVASNPTDEVEATTVASNNSIDGGQNRSTSNISGESALNVTEVELVNAVNGTGNSTESEALNCALNTEQQRRCMSVDDTIRAVITIYDKFPVGIPKPFHILLSYGEHHWNISRPRRSD